MPRRTSVNSIRSGSEKFCRSTHRKTSRSKRFHSEGGVTVVPRRGLAVTRPLAFKILIDSRRTLRLASYFAPKSASTGKSSLGSYRPVTMAAPMSSTIVRVRRPNNASAPSRRYGSSFCVKQTYWTRHRRASVPRRPRPSGAAAAATAMRQNSNASPICLRPRRKASATSFRGEMSTSDCPDRIRRTNRS